MCQICGSPLTWYSYLKGKSVESALYEVVVQIKPPLNYKEYTLGTVLVIEEKPPLKGTKDSLITRTVPKVYSYIVV